MEEALRVEGRGSGDSLQSSLPESAHTRECFSVIPDQPHGLLKCPRGSAAPLELANRQILAKRFSSVVIEHVPRGNKVQRGISRTKAPAVQNTHQSFPVDEQIVGDQVTVCHRDLTCWRENPKGRPQITKAANGQ